MGGSSRGSYFLAEDKRPFFGSWRGPFLISSHRFLNFGVSPPGTLSATGTRGSFTIPHSIASMSEKSLIVHGNKVPSTYPEPRRKNRSEEHTSELQSR